MSPNQSRARDIPLLRTKISKPRSPAEFVHRPRLTEQIDRGVKGPLTLLVAPAGFGKTNLLIEWAEATSLSVAWLTIDSADNDPGRLFRYIIGALQTLEPGLGEEALDYLQSSQGSSGAATMGGLEIGLTLLINEIAALPKEIVLVLDDFHALEVPTTIPSAALISANHFLKNLPQNLHLVIASRDQPPLDLSFLRSKGLIVELGADDLRFTGEEVGHFIQQMIKLQLPEEMIRTLEKRTDGWVTGLQMAALSMRNQSDPTKLLDNLEGDAHYLVDFLAEEVLDRQPEEIRLFLLRSSILDTLSGPLCEAVVNPEAQPGYGTVMLNRLEHARLFITALDDRHEIFRYHNLFVDFLRHVHAEINPAEIPVLQKRAALWYEQHADLDEALKYAMAYATASGDMEWAAELIQRNIQSMIKTGEIFSLTRWIAMLPDAMIHLHPALGLAYAWGLIAAYQLDLARYWLEDVRQSLDQHEKLTGIALHISGIKTGQETENAGPWNIRGGLAVCQSTLALLSGDMEQAAEFSRQATSYLQEDNPFIQSLLALDDSLYYILSGDTLKAVESLRNTSHIARQANNLLVSVIAACQLADMLVLQGKLNQAYATLQKAQYFTFGPDGKPLPLGGLVEIGFGEIFLERGLLEEAHLHLEQGFQAAQSLWPISSLDGMVSLARLRHAEGNYSGAKDILTEASRMAFSTESSQWDDNLISAVATRLALQRGDLTEAEQWWIKGGLPDLSEMMTLEKYPYHIFEYQALTQARFLLMREHDTGRSDDLQQASEILGALLLEAERFQRLTSKIEILVLQALVQDAQGDIRAKDTLLQALALGEPQGYQWIYMAEGWRLKGLLRQCQSAQQISGDYLPSLAFIDHLLSVLPNDDTDQQAVHHSVLQRGRQITAQTEYGLPIVLSAREIEVLKLIAEGKSNQEISSELYLALNTVKRHAYNIYAKLEVKKRTQAVSKARQLGLIS